MIDVRILRPSRREHWRAIGLSVVVAAMCYQLVIGSSRFGTIGGWCLIATMAFFTVLHLYFLLFPRGHLRLDGAGLTVRDGSKQTFYAWSEVASFKVGDVGDAGDAANLLAVYFDLTDEGHRNHPEPPGAIAFLKGDRVLLTPYGGLSAPALADLLNQSLAEASARPRAASA